MVKGYANIQHPDASPTKVPGIPDMRRGKCVIVVHGHLLGLAARLLSLHADFKSSIGITKEMLLKDQDTLSGSGSPAGLLWFGLQPHSITPSLT